MRIINKLATRDSHKVPFIKLRIPTIGKPFTLEVVSYLY